MSYYVANLLVLILLYSVLSVSLNLGMGQAGLFSVAQAAFFGIGAFATADISTRWPQLWLLSVVAGMVIAATVGLVVGLIAVRVSDDYLVISTFGVQTIATALFLNWNSVTGGAFGITSIPLPNILGWSPANLNTLVLFIAVVACIEVAIVVILGVSPYGRGLRAIRDDPIGAAAAGRSPTMHKASAFALTGALAAVAGSLYAGFSSFVSSTDFTLDLSVLVLVMVLLGGLDSVAGAIVGAVILVLVPAGLQQLPIPIDLVGYIQQVIYGLLLMAIALGRPQGIMGGRDWQLLRARLRYRPPAWREKSDVPANPPERS